MELSSPLFRAFRLPPHPSIAFVGAGGKTTALFEMARSAAPAVVTTTTHLAEAQSALADCHIVWSAGTPCDDLGLADHDGVMLVTGDLDAATGRLTGLSATQWRALRRCCAARGRTLLVEADGSRQRPLKAPAMHEPAIPEAIDAVVVVAGMLGCGLPLDDEHVHRPARFSAISGCPLGEPVTAEALAAVLIHPEGGLKNIPAGARRAALLSQADTPGLREQAAAIARLLRPVYDTVVVASFRNGWVENL
jgi:molybdenum cofactor cytidylyltransferase